jgi:hypothetical protein
LSAVSREYAGSPLTLVSAVESAIAGRYIASDGFTATTLTIESGGSWHSSTVSDVGPTMSNREGLWTIAGSQLELVAPSGRCDRVRRFDTLRYLDSDWLVDGRARAAVCSIFTRLGETFSSPAYGVMGPDVFVRLME